MKLPELNAVEARVIGCLIEKSVITPDQYPLTLNALTNACNQKSSRDPVMSLAQGEVQHAVRTLADKHLVMIDENFRGRAEKYSQRFCNTRYSELQFDEAERAIVTLLLLRGPQTPGELRSRSGRLHTFDDNTAVSDTLARLQQHDAGPIVVRLPQRPGRRDAEYTHCFGGPVTAADNAVTDTTRPRSAATASPPRDVPQGRDRIGALTERVERLERQVAALLEAAGGGRGEDRA